MRNSLTLVGELALFAWLVMKRAFVPPYEWEMILYQIEEVGWKSLSLVFASGLSIGVVLTLHTRSSLVRFGAESLIPAVQSLSFFVEIGPLVAGLLVAGRVGAGIGAELANLRVTEQIDAIESFSIDSIKILVIPRIVACIFALPILTVFIDIAGLLGGYLVESRVSHLSLQLFLNRAFSQVNWITFLPPTLKTAVFGFLIGLISTYYGYKTDEGSTGVGRAATRSVVLSSLCIILADVVLVKAIFFFFSRQGTMSDQSEFAVVFENVSKRFGQRVTLDSVSFSIPAGEALCVMGRSGTGKSVTLKLMIGLLKPDEGTICIQNRNICGLDEDGLSEVRRNMGFLFQSAALFDSFTLNDNLRLPLERFHAKPKDEIDAHIQKTLDQVGLGDDRGKMPSELSGGMRKRAGLARALVLEPSILLVDEPSSGLDRLTAGEIDSLLLSVKENKRTTMIIVTHDIHGARRVGDRIAVLDQGKLAAIGTAKDWKPTTTNL